MTQASTLLAGGFLLGGLFFSVVAAVGVLRLPDLYCRAHALGKAMTLGMVFFLLAVGLAVPDASWFKILVAIAFQFVTIPVASHLLCLAAYRRRMPRWTAKGWTVSDGRPTPTVR
jgi:multicomponent Na+:H+ antiporter subunit G